MMNIHRTVRAPLQAKAESMVKRSNGGGIDAKEAVHKHEKHLHKGEKETKLKKGGRVPRKRGGSVPGEKPPHRLDKRARGGNVGDMLGGDKQKRTQPQINADSEKAEPNRARGGHVGKHHKAKTNIIINAGGGDDPMKMQAAKQEGAKMGAMAVISKLKGAGGAPGAPPPGGPPPGVPPMGAAPPMGAGVPPMHAKGGAIAKDPVAGQLAARQSGPGRLARMEKSGERKGEIKVRAHTRKRGGAC